MAKDFSEYKKENTKNQEKNEKQHGSLKTGIDDIKDILQEFKLDIKSNYITNNEAKKTFASKLTEKLVYSTAGMMLTAVVVGLIYLVVNK